MARSLLAPDDGVDIVSRADLLSLRTPNARGVLNARFYALRKALREMGYDPEVLDHYEWRSRKLTLAEKTYSMLVVYCGLNHEQALATLLQSCGVASTPQEVKRKASMISRAVENTFVGGAVRLLLRDAERVLELTPERTLEELYRIAMGNIADVATWDGHSFVLKDLETLPRSCSAIIASVKRTEARDGSVSWELKLNDKVKALELLMKHFGLLTEKVEITVDQTLASRIDSARRRVFEGELATPELLEDKRGASDSI